MSSKPFTLPELPLLSQKQHFQATLPRNSDRNSKDKYQFSQINRKLSLQNYSSVPQNPIQFFITPKQSSNPKFFTRNLTSTSLSQSTLSQKRSSLFTSSYILKKTAEDQLRFFISPGNNDSLISQILNDRNWARTYSIQTANLIWTDSKQSQFFELLFPDKDSRKNLKTYIDNSSLSLRLYNQLEGDKELTSSKRLFKNLTSYYKSFGENPFKFIPVSFHVFNSRDPSFSEFIKKFNEVQKSAGRVQEDNIWIVKPAEGRSLGAVLCVSTEEVANFIDDKKSGHRSYIVQKYLSRPFLYSNRKFDIRCFCLVTCVESKITAYVYKEGYLKTSSKEFSVENKDSFVHLTSDYVQQQSQEYGKFEDCNKLSFSDLESYLDKSYANPSFKEVIYPKIKHIVLDAIKSTYKILSPNRLNTFQLLSFDFLLDETFSPYLISIDSSPQLSPVGNYLARLVPKLLAHVFDIILPGVPSSMLNQFEPVFSFVLN